jgi:hypothetical protein
MTERSTAHLPRFHRRAPIKEPCRVATTGPITIATALNAGDTIDGVTLAAGDRVLVWQQSTASQNGIYIVGATPARAYDMDTAAEVPGVLVTVTSGSTYASSLFVNTNVALGFTLDSSSIDFQLVTASGADAELNIEGGQDAIKAHGSMGSTETFDPTDGNVHTGTLDADCTFTVSAPSGSGAATLTFVITASGTRTWTWPGSFTWLAGSAPDPPADGLTEIVIAFSWDGGTNWIAGPWGGGSASPLTTKGDLWGYSTVDAAVPVGTDGDVLTADSSAALGVSYQTPAATGHYELLMAAGSSPVEPLETADGLDWLYVWVSG